MNLSQAFIRWVKDKVAWKKLLIVSHFAALTEKQEAFYTCAPFHKYFKPNKSELNICCGNYWRECNRHLQFKLLNWPYFYSQLTYLFEIASLHNWCALFYLNKRIKPICFFPKVWFPRCIGCLNNVSYNKKKQSLSVIGNANRGIIHSITYFNSL